MVYVTYLEIANLHWEVQHELAHFDAHGRPHSGVPSPQDGGLQDGLIVGCRVGLGTSNGRRLRTQIQNLYVHGLDEGVLHKHFTW